MIPPPPPKDILFYSKQCLYCNDLFQLMKKNNVNMNNFMLVCIDDLQSIPQGIVAVPTLVLQSKNNAILVDEELFGYINEKKELGSFVTKYSNSFSFLDDEDDGFSISSFSNRTVKSPADFSDPVDKSSDNKKDMQIDKLIAERDKDIKNITT